MKIYRTSHQGRIERASREAAEWLRVMNDAPDAGDQKELMAWIQASPLHLRELLVLQALEHDLEASGAMNDFDIDAVVAAAKAEDNVVALHDAPQSESSEAEGFGQYGTGGWRVPIWARVAVLAGVLIVCGAWAWLMLAPSGNAQQFATNIGQQRVITLADGTKITMAPSSKLSVSMSSNQRDVILHAGEAWFDVVHNDSKPFRVYAGASVIQDVGTHFGVNRLPSGTVVTVTEGEVKVMADHMSALHDGVGAWFKSWLPADVEVIRQPDVAVTPLGGQREVTVGQVAHITSNGRELTLTGIQRDGEGNVANAKQLIFYDNTLADIAAEFNRYNNRQIVVRGKVARMQRYSGVFAADDARSFLKYLDCCSRLELTSEGSHVVVQLPDGK